MTEGELLTVYAERYNLVLREIERLLQMHLADIIGKVPRIDRIAARAKAPDRFIAKATKVDSDGKKKYDDPVNEIQDQIGARITVFYLQDVTRVREQVLKYFTAIEIQEKKPSRSAEFGYFGEHFILKIPDDLIPEAVPTCGCPKFFELQIKTLFQHAWSEADHDLAYKSFRELDEVEKRQIGFSAAQAWGADQIFADLAKKLVQDFIEGESATDAPN